MVFQTAIEGQYPDIYVNPAMVKISYGSLPGLIALQVDRSNSQIILSWNRDFCYASVAYYDDVIVGCAYDVLGGVAAVNEQLVIRDDGQMQMQLPEGMETTAVHLYVIV